MKHTRIEIDQSQQESASRLLVDLREAHATLLRALEELDFILQQPTLNTAALTTLRLSLASMRLTRGSLVARLMASLINKVTREEASLLMELQSGHHNLLRLANAHTTKWTLEAIVADWPTYKLETRAIISRWRAKADREQKAIFPLLHRMI